MNKNLVCILVIIAMASSFVSCKKHNENPPLTREFEYIYFMNSDSVKEIWRFNSFGRIEKFVYDTLQDSVLVTYLYNSDKELVQKRYYFLNDKKLAYRSVDTVADEKIICNYTYTYNDEGYLLRLDYVGAQYTDLYKTVGTAIQGYTEYDISQGNTVKISMHKVFSGLQTVVKDVVYEQIYTELPNTDGIQQGWERFLGTRNQHLLQKVMYSYKENSKIVESGVYNYTYDINDTTKRLRLQTELYTSDNESNVPLKTLTHYVYK